MELGAPDAADRVRTHTIRASEKATTLTSLPALSDVKELTNDYRDFDRIVELGYLVEAVNGLCGPHLRLLTDIADALYAIDEGGKTPHKVGSKH